MLLKFAIYLKLIENRISSSQTNNLLQSHQQLPQQLHRQNRQQQDRQVFHTLWLLAQLKRRKQMLKIIDIRKNQTKRITISFYGSKVHLQ